jgi:two-component system sensor histidine kinase PilS (NtrC family)
MNQPPEAFSWPTSSLMSSNTEPGDHPREFERLWLGLMTARATLGLVLVLLQGSIFFLVPQQNSAPLVVCLAYFIAALAVRLMTRVQQLGHMFELQWLRTVGIDLLAFATLQVLQGGAINYTPLFALPVLMVSILGSMLTAMAAAAGVTLLLFAYATWLSLQSTGDFNTIFLQAALTGAGCFAVSFIASQLTNRLASVELRAQRNQLAATVQRQVNDLVIESLTDGILVVDERGWVRSANPAAHLLLDTRSQTQGILLNLSSCAGWQPLMDIISTSFSSQNPQLSDTRIHRTGYGSRRLRVRTRLTASPTSDAVGLCVVFMQDQREIQARVRAEKLVSMGRMSAAVAHEIRNPLAAIAQANALLTEDLSDPAQQRLARIVGQNAVRLENIVQDILLLTHAGAPEGQPSTQWINLTQDCQRVCRDWNNQNGIHDELTLTLAETTLGIWFDSEHLRRILVNLLDNARRYASQRVDCIQVSTHMPLEGAPAAVAYLRVWSDGAPLEPSVEQHLFEPFFSSESRSSGLGLYICRELCENHAANITYERSERLVDHRSVQGNEFSVMFKCQSDNPPTMPQPLDF